MLTLTLNPGLALIIFGLLALATPRAARAPMMAGAALLALWLLLDRDFGAAAARAQMGLEVVPLSLNALNRIFGIGMLIVLVAIALFSSARRNRYEDAAILILAGGAVSALFVGDFLFFVAAAAVAGLAAAWTVFASPLEGANRAGARLLIWHGLEGLLFLIGVAMHITARSGSVELTRMDVRTIEGGCIFAALMIRVGGPLAHVWFKDVISHASPTGAAALSAFTTMLGVYALALLFPAEPLLIPIGAAMIAIGGFFAAADDDLRRAAAYALMAQNGVCIALIGLGSPLALAAAEGHAFAAMLAFAALQMAIGGVVERARTARVSDLTGLAQVMPVSAFLMLAAGLAAAAAPGSAMYATHAVALDALAQWDTRVVWAMIAALPAVVLLSVALKPALTANRPTAKARARNEAPFAMLLGSGLATFLSLAVGLAPGWLYDLMPAALVFEPYAIDRIAPHLELLGVAGLAFLGLRLIGAAPKRPPHILLDIDALYRGPLASAGRWLGVVMLRVYGAWHDATARSSQAAADRIGQWASACDRPFTGSAAAVAAQFLSLAAILLIALLFV